MFEERLANPGAVAPANAPAIRALIARERRGFAERWLVVSSVAGVLFVVPAWLASRGARRLGRST